MSDDRLFLDLGNTRLKWLRPETCRPEATALDPSAHAPTQGRAPLQALTHSDAPDCWAPLLHSVGTEPSAIWLASVAGARTTVLEDYLAAHWRCPVTRVQSPARFGAWQTSYAQPQRLGVDRFLGMLGAQVLTQRIGGDLLVVMVGTAITLDVLTQSGQHLGGLIAPGPTLMRTSLHRSTGALPLVAENANAPQRLGPQRLGQATDQAIALGSVRACAALIDALALEHPRAQLVLSGGAAPEVAPWLRRTDYTHSPELVLRGLMRFAQGE